MQTIHIGLIGLGTVGTGVYQIIKEHQEEISHQTGYQVAISKILVRDASKPRDPMVDRDLLTSDENQLIQNPEIDVVIEVAGGVDTAYEMVKAALNNHKHVITANKDLMAIHGGELLTLAKDQGCDLFFEASVGGGIPIIRALTQSLSSDKITSVVGIVNGTTNYILTKMDHEGMSYDAALKEAQDLGFAEADPTSDVGGFDAGRKMTILGSLAFSMALDLEDVRISGIEGINDIDLAYGKDFGYEIKLLGIAKMEDEAVSVSVGPTFIPHNHPLTSVHGEYNAVYVKGEAVGTTMFYGPGAGGLPTATAIVSDVVTVVKNMALGTTGMAILAPRREKVLRNSDAIKAPYYLRLEVADQVGVLSEITAMFAEKGMSIEKILQIPVTDKVNAEIIIVTHDISLKCLESALSSLESLSSVNAVKGCYPIEKA